MSWWHRLQRFWKGGQGKPRQDGAETGRAGGGKSPGVGTRQEGDHAASRQKGNDPKGRWEEVAEATGLRARFARFQENTSTQFVGVDETWPRIQIVIGLDFGTSYTKVAIGESRIHYAVPFREDQEGVQRYLVPGVLDEDVNGNCAIGSTEAHRQFNNLKVPLLQKEFSVDTQARIVAYLALVLRHARGWLMAEHGETYKGYGLEWFVNVGLPTANALDRALTGAYSRIVHAAWGLSVRQEPVTLALAEEALKRAGERLESSVSEDESGFLHPDAISSFPEFVAQVASYVRSPMKSEDLHVLVDIGAGTLDVTVFNVMEDEGEYRYPIMARTVKPLGTEFLMRNRNIKSKKGKELEYQAQDPVPEATDLSVLLGVSLSEIEEMDKEFARKVRENVGEPIRYTKTQRYPMSRKWKEGVPFFLCGGGAKCGFYQKTISEYLELANWSSVLRALPRPEGLQAPGLENDQFDRLAVAYGLSMDALDIGELVRPEDIEDVPRENESAAWKEKFIDKDQV